VEGPQPMIELDEFDFPAKDYFRIAFLRLAMHYFWGWAYLTVFVFAYIAVFYNDFLIIPIIISFVLAVFFTITAFVTARSYAYSKENLAVTQKRKMIFENGTYHVVCEDGSEGRGPMDHFHRASIMCGYYCLFLNKVSYFVVPVTAFRSDEDRVRFETEILGDKLKKNGIPWKKIVIFLLVAACLFGSAIALRSTQAETWKDREHYIENREE
jgi:branched-subunit amino acid ABC-type transport system permease component